VALRYLGPDVSGQGLHHEVVPYRPILGRAMHQKLISSMAYLHK
jgi:hypothetical protein